MSLTFLLFTGRTCKPCDNLKKDLSDKHPDFKYETVDAFEDERAIEYRIRSTPTLISIDGNGKVVDQVVGYSKQEDKEKIEALVFKQLKF